MTNYLYSIQSPYVAPIMNGDKTKELRKSAPKPPFVMWIYVTKAEPKLAQKHPVINRKYDTRIILGVRKYLNGLVVAKCVVDSVEEIKSIEGCFHDEFIYTTYPRLLKQLCLSDNEVSNYGKGKPLYALHLSQVEILDNPLQVSDFFNPNLWMLPHEIYAMSEENKKAYRLTRAPQSYQKVIPPEVRK